MSKKRFVEFYLSAMMKAATAGRVIRLVYSPSYVDLLPDREFVTVHFDDGSCVPFDVIGCTLLEIAETVLAGLCKMLDKNKGSELDDLI